VISLTSTQNAAGNGTGGRETSNFCYDEQNRLVWAGNSGTQPGAGNGTCGSGTLASGLTGASYSNSYVYTHLGQLWQGPLNGSGTQEQYLYCSSSQPHQLTGLYGTSATCASKSGQVYGSSYDAWGNVTSRSITNGTSLLTYTLSYDGLDHLVRWNDTQTTTNEEWYMYDGAGQRVLRRSQTGTGTSNTKYTVYAFGVQDDVYDGSGASSSDKYYYSLAGHLLGELNGGKTKFLLTDLLGSVVASISNTANSAAVLGNQVYGPYGNGSYSKGTITTPKGYTGQYNDTLTTLDYFNARYYDPAVGVFLSADTVLGNGSGENPYAYVGGNPETWSDPSGHSFIPPSGGGSSGNSLVPFTPPSGSSNTNAVQPCLAVGCAAGAKVGTPVLVTRLSRTLINVAAIVCAGFCFIVPTTVISTNITSYWTYLESSLLACGLPYPCSDEGSSKQESNGKSGHDVSPASGGPAGSSGSGEAGDASEESSQTADEGGNTLKQDLYRRFNKYDQDVGSSVPTGQGLRYANHTPSGVVDVTLDENGMVRPGPDQGYSLFTQPEAKGTWFKLPGGIPVPVDTGFTPPDASGHSLFQPTVPMSLSDFMDAFDTFSGSWEKVQTTPQP